MKRPPPGPTVRPNCVRENKKKKKRAKTTRKRILRVFVSFDSVCSISGPVYLIYDLTPNQPVWLLLFSLFIIGMRTTYHLESFL